MPAQVPAWTRSQQEPEALLQVTTTCSMCDNTAQPLLCCTHRKDELDRVWGHKQAGPKGCEVLGQAHGLVWPGLLQGDNSFRLPALLLLTEVLAQGRVQPQGHLHWRPAEVVGDVQVVFLDGIVRSGEGKEQGDDSLTS